MHILAKLDITLTPIDVATALAGKVESRPQARLAQLVCACNNTDLLGMLYDLNMAYPWSVVEWSPQFRKMGYYRAFLFDDGSMIELTDSGTAIYQF